MAKLQPCHSDVSQFYVAERKPHVASSTSGSADVFLGVPVLTSLAYALFTMMVHRFVD